MKILELQKKPLNIDDYIKRSAVEADFETLIKEPCVITENGEIKIVYDVLDLNTKDIVSALQNIKYTVGMRTRGLKSTSRIFGYRPRSPIRGNFCSSTSMASQHPKEHALVCDLALKIEDYYKKYNPTGYEKHQKITKEMIKDSYRINGESVFTSGIINKNNPLKYHFDTGNFKEVSSMMIVFKGGVDGGYLSCPEYGIGFELPNNSIIMFDGQSILHGVTPIIKTTEMSYRYSIVYYSLQQIWKCLIVGEEIDFIRANKTKREKLRHNMPEEHRQKLLARRGKQ